jgi:hypothetical protein
MNDELNDFLKDIPTDQDTAKDIFGEQPENPTEEVDVTETPKADEPYKNRRHRRLEQQLETEREARIRAEARAEVLSETRKFAQETNVDERLLRLYGTDENGKEAARLQTDILNDYAARAKEEAKREMMDEQRASQAEQKQQEQFIDSELEALEDEHDIDLTSKSPQARKQRNELLALVEKLSPKDKDGNVLNYADFSGAYEILKSQAVKPDNTRQKQLASNSMTSSAPVDQSQAEADATKSWLQANGII